MGEGGLLSTQLSCHTSLTTPHSHASVLPWPHLANHNLQATPRSPHTSTALSLRDVDDEWNTLNEVFAKSSTFSA